MGTNRFLDVFQEARGHFLGVTEGSQSRAIEDELWTEGGIDLEIDRSISPVRNFEETLLEEGGGGYSIFLSSFFNGLSSSRWLGWISSRVKIHFVIVFFQFLVDEGRIFAVIIVYEEE